MFNNKKIKYGVVGAGYLGGYHVEQISKFNNVDIVGVFDVVKDKAVMLSDKFNIPVCSSLNNLIDLCDAISICVPASNHYDIASVALKNNCHLFIEKPITNNLNHAKKIIEINSNKNKIIQIGHIERYNAAYTAYLKNKKQPLFIEAHRLAPFNIRGLDVPVVLDLMIHDIDLVLNMVRDDIVSIHASGTCVVSDFVDLCHARIKFKNGCVANITASRVSSKQMRKMRVFEKNTYSSLNFQTQDLQSWKINSDASINQIPIKNNVVNALYEELKSFIESISSGGFAEINEHEGYKALEIAIKIQSLIEKKTK